MAKDNKIKRFIRQECLEQGLDDKAFTDKFESSMIQRGADLGTRPDNSTINRWINAQKTPMPKWFPYIADVLGVSEDELRSGHRFIDGNTLTNEESIELENRRKAMKVILNLIRMNKYFNYVLSLIFLSIGIYCLNYTLWKNPYLSLISLCMFICTFIYDNRKAPDRNKNPKNKFTLKKVIQDYFLDILEFWKICQRTSLIGSVSKICFAISVFIFCLPILELILHDGKLFISCTIYFMLCLFFLFRSRKNFN